MASDKAAFFKAIQEADLDTLRQVVNKGLDPKSTTYQGQPIIVLAIECGHVKVVSLLLDLGIDANETIKSGYDEVKPLHLACKEGKRDIVELLLPLTDLATCKGEHYDGLHIHVAAKMGHVDVLRLLLTKGVDVNLRAGVNEETPLLAAVAAGQEVAVKFLLEQGADVSQLDRRENSGLHRAAAGGHCETLKTLIEAGANINEANDYGATSLHLTKGSDSSAMAQLLLQNGAEINAQEASGATPLHRAITKADLPLAQCLINAEAELNLRQKNGRSPLTLACREGREELVQLLLKASAEAESKDLFYAIENKSLSIVQGLISAGVDLELSDDRGWQALHLASSLGYTSIAKSLVEAKAPINGLTTDGLTPRDVARKQKELFTEQTLAELGGVTTIEMVESENKILTNSESMEEYKKSMGLPAELESYRDKLLATVQPFLRLHATSGKALYPWESKIGGTPYLPKDCSYPTTAAGEELFFLAQINFAETPPLPGFPSSGLLSFYLIADYIMCDNKAHEVQDNFRVLWFDEVLKEPEKLTLDFDFLPLFKETPIPQPYALKFERHYAPMSWEDARFKEAIGKNLYQIWESSFEEKEELFKTRLHKVGGYAAFVQDDPRYYFDPMMAEFYESNRAEDYEDDDDAPGGRRYVGPRHETLLLQIASYDGTDICWGDCGTAAFFIDTKALAKKDFSRVFFDWACA